MTTEMSTDDICYRGVHDLAGHVQRREISPVEIVDAYLQRIEALNPRLSAYLTLTADSAREEALRAEAEIAAGRWRGPLHGIPYGVKDIIETKGVRTTHGSSFFPDFVPERDAECITRLQGAGAIMLGKTLTHEFAAATTTINPHYGTAHNPWNLDCITGGSSGGSAAAVAAGLCAFALGSDTGGSIRNPAALCGVVGFKPTHGRTSLVGVCPNVMTFDHLGPITFSARDAALVLQTLARYDPRDAASRDMPVPDFTEGWQRGVRGLRLVLCPDFYMNAEVDSEVEHAFAEAVRVFRSLGATVEVVSFRNGKRLTELFPAISGPEFAEFHRPFYEKNPDGYGASVRERLEWSLKISSDEYVRGLRERELLRREVAEFFRGKDALLLPAMPCTAPRIDSLMANVNGKEYPCMWIHRPFQNPANLTGCPAVALPMGFDRKGLPLSLQIVGPEWSDGRILGIASAYEAATPEIRTRRAPCA
jgi:aspartyl-tRNA(Asn)/glutamyl-tRNA(Gln) amidotransferase subunit A